MVVEARNYLSDRAIFLEQAPGGFCMVHSQCTGGSFCSEALCTCRTGMEPKNGTCQAGLDMKQFSNITSCVTDDLALVPYCPRSFYQIAAPKPVQNLRGRLIFCQKAGDAAKTAQCPQGAYCNMYAEIDGVCCPIPGRMTCQVTQREERLRILSEPLCPNGDEPITNGGHVQNCKTDKDCHVADRDNFCTPYWSQEPSICCRTKSYPAIPCHLREWTICWDA